MSSTATQPKFVTEFRDATDGSAAADLAKALTFNEPRPEISALEPDEVELPIGVTIGGELVRVGRVRELTGADEEEMERAATSATPERLLAVLLERGVVSLGRHTTQPDVLDGMAVGDRDALIIGIRKATYGNTIEYERYVCPKCEESFALSVDLDDIPTVEWPTPGDTTMTVKLRKDRQARIRLATGLDQYAVLSATRNKKVTGAEQDTLLLSRCVLAIIAADGTEREVTTDPAHVREGLGIADRNAIKKALHERRPGPRLDQVAITCPDCEFKQEVNVTLDALFRS